MSLPLRFALKNNLPLLEYVTLPRTGALEAILNVLGPHAGSVDLSLVEDMAGQLGDGNIPFSVPTEDFPFSTWSVI